MVSFEVRVTDDPAFEWALLMERERKAMTKAMTRAVPKTVSLLTSQLVSL